MEILLINGANLNLLGNRENSIYGNDTLEDIEKNLSEICKENSISFASFQSNAEHELVDRIQEAQSEGIKCIIFNPGAFTHSSIALRDALNGTGQKFIEVHISNIYGREDFRQKSFLSDIADGVISGLGTKGYELALEVAIKRYS